MLFQRPDDDNVLSIRPYFWSPLIESFLYPVDHICSDHSTEREYYDTDKNLVGLERRAGYCDHESNPGSGRVQHANHDTNERSSDRQPQPGKNKWNRRGHHHALKYLPLRSAKASGGAEETDGRGLHAVSRINDQREYRAEKNNANLREHSDPQPDDDQGQ